MSKKLLIAILSLIMALSVFAMAGCELLIEDYPETSSGSTEQGSTGSTDDSSTGGTDDSSTGTEEHTHTYGNWEITKPTQTEAGTAKKVCEECEAGTAEKEITVTLPMLTDAGYQVTEDTATCDQAGKITYKFPYNEEMIEFDVETTAKGHTWDNGKVTSVPTTEKEGETTYTCSVCKGTKVEPIEKIAFVDAGVATVDTAVTFSEKETIICQKKLADGIKVVGVTGGTVVIDGNKKIADSIEFLYRLKLGGTIKKDYRYIEVSVDKACMVKVYAMSSSKNTTRYLNMYASLTDLTEAGVLESKEVNGDTLTAVEYSIAKAGTYYFGSSGSGINVYGIYITFPEVHNFSTEWKYDEENHYHVCLNEGCTEVDGKASHTWNDGVVTKKATCEEEGEMTYTCTVCPKTKTEAITKLGHKFATDWNADEENHYHVCLNEGCKEVDGKAPHTFGAGVVTKKATCEEEGVMTYTCTTCKKEKTEAITKLGHNYATFWSYDDANHFHTCLNAGCTKVDGSASHTWNDGIVTKPATCQEKGVKTYTCTVCPKQKTEVISKQKHNYAPFWNYDEENHYHACLNEGCKEVDGKAVHTYGDGIITKPATCKEEGVMTYVCTVCPKTKTEPINKLAHNYATFWNFDEENHFHACLNAGCTEVADKAVHTWDAGIVTKPATTEEEGVMTYTCTVCPKQKTEVIGKVVHNFSTEWSYDDVNHYHACVIEGCTEVADKASHTWDEGTVTKPATTEEEGVKTYTCTVCKKEKTEAIDKLVDTDVVTENTDITFSTVESITTEKKLATGVKVVASTDKPVTLVANEKGKDGIDFTHGLKLGGKINADSRYIQIKAGMACKVKIYAMSAKTEEPRVMNMFKALADIAGDPLQTQNVLTGNNLTVLEFHITEVGTYYFGSFSGGIDVYGIYITKAPHAHNFDTAKWASNEESHYHACTIEGCTEALERAMHTFDAGVVTKEATTETAGVKTYTCTVCGKTKTEEIPKLQSDGNVSLTFSGKNGEKLTTAKDFGNGVKAVATSEKFMTYSTNGKTIGDKTFDCSLNLGGALSPTHRYFEITVNKPCTIKVYAENTNSGTRTLVICTSPDKNTQKQSASFAKTTKVVEFTITEAGTYYLGSTSGGILVYGIDIIYS